MKERSALDGMDENELRAARELARRAREAADASVGNSVKIDTLPEGLRDRIASLAPRLHPLRGHAELVDGHPVLVFQLMKPLSVGDRAPAFIPYAWNGFFGAALTLTLYDLNQSVRVLLRPDAPVIAALRTGEFTAVMVDASGSIVGAYRLTLAESPPAIGLLREQLETLAQLDWRYGSPETYELEMLAEAPKTWPDLLLSRDERNSIEWMDWFRIVLGPELKAAAEIVPKVRELDLQGLPDVIRQIVESFVPTGELAKTAPVIHEFLAANDLRSWMHALTGIEANEPWKPCGDLAAMALRTYLQGPQATNFGRRLPFVTGRTGAVEHIELDLREIERKISFGEFWARQAPHLRFNWGHLISGADIPVSPDIFSRRLADFPRAENVDETEAAAEALLGEAVASKQWTIPPHACVQLEIGPFKHLEVTELHFDVGIVMRTENGEFFIATIEPDKHFFDVDLPMPPDVDEVATDSVSAAMSMLLAAVIRDFWVVERREAVFRSVDRERAPWNPQGRSDGPRVVYLPRVRYAPKLDVLRCKTELHITSRREHVVAAHLRKSKQSSHVQKALARRYGFSVPTGYTFVRPHERGREKRDVIYRSRSALGSLFAVDGELDVRTSVKWFEFERDVQRLLARMGFSVEHVAASRRGDRGVDVFARSGEGPDEACWVIQCKCWSASRKVGPDVVRELVGARAPYPAGTRAMIVTTSGFTSGAKELAATHDIELMDGEEFHRRLSADER